MNKIHNKIWILLLLLTVLMMSGCGKEEKPESNNMQVEKNPIVTIEMEGGGTIKVELEPNVAPNTVANFVSLVEDQYYDGLTFHRVIPSFMVQGGDPDGNGTGGPGYSIAGEFSTNDFENNIKHERGVISMARSQDPNSAGSQFFIMVADVSQLDGDYAAFGKVTEGMDVVDQIVSVERDAVDKPLEEQKMKKVTVETFGITYPAVKKVQ
ncbi:peptidylprolyl isomerase [Lederbergia galactosidilytica]|uniref:Peptidyl-prolyl cis-trans isomerase n=1 Tax=Lederbergia galactosidilytica TaxID=217031 RepID=A0A178A6V7_9BACI|nr:peptidylprolyl isomerase [Lederbergia galactosidilytica]KRG16359.1 peptidylprolyl isomerase [Virgibacillus soli]MBP1915059.1 peptidyl-prolyl cis-trans isomerase B (cyclophilin B) [Lederbergia galactosidilytica]OAK75569.1 peptidylprolyl isomerase [Lederbergia galactosidilytica]